MYFAKRYLSNSLAALLALTLVACATQSTTPPGDPPAVEHLLLNEGHLVPTAPGAQPYQDVDTDPLLRLLVAEFAGQRGQMPLAVEHYVRAAKDTRDLEVAKRATRVAIFARNDAQALAAARIWVELAPEDAEGRQILAAMHIRAGNSAAAIAELEHVLSTDGDGENRQLKMIANLLSRESDKQTALAVMERLLEQRQNDVDALHAYALMSIRAEELEKANAAMQRVLEVAAVDSNIAVAYVSLLQKHEKSRDAISWLERAIERGDDYGLRLIYARLLADSSRYEDARRQFSILATQTPDNSDVVYALGLLNLQANRIDDAHANFQQLLKIEARVNDANFYLAQIAESRERIDEALDLYRAVDGGTNYFHAQIRIAILLSNDGDVEGARAHLSAITPEDDEQRLQIIRAEGEMLTQHDQLDEAMSVYDRVLADTYDMELLYARAMLAERMGRLDILEADLRRILEREPDNAQALNALGYTLADQTDRYEEAYQFIARALELNPNDFYILDSMGWVLYRLGRFSEAVSFLQRARSIKDDPEVAAHLGEVLWVMGDKEAARDIWDSALKIKPDDQRLLDVIERLAP